MKKVENRSDQDVRVAADHYEAPEVTTFGDVVDLTLGDDGEDPEFGSGLVTWD